ncbi:uncharacterized protein N7515_004642 [Penicillium bovifimosum]|uniref:Uncharacterized protein n=1 Tax=Penicillium bovifimosum TaxID=126998 RepID=A0A9W9H0I9_9EURO|nr:uncharacterized protein N7515_004642 [Penicillium bovifimosum]KAJ5135364.1 hypothetical protein N7515_004642 [Penicillium bovifimosum]
MSSPSFFSIGIIDINPEFNLFLSNVPMANLSCAFFICWQEYSTEGIPLTTAYLSDESVRDEETTTGVEFREGSLTPLGGFIPAILQSPLVIRNIQNDPRIGGLKLVVYEWVWFIKQNPGYIERPFFSVSTETVHSYIRNQLTLQGVLDQNGSFAAQCFTYPEPCNPAGTRTAYHLTRSALGKKC